MVVFKARMWNVISRSCKGQLCCVLSTQFKYMYMSPKTARRGARPRQHATRARATALAAGRYAARAARMHVRTLPWKLT